MQVKIDKNGPSSVAIITDPELSIQNTQDALDLMVEIKHTYDCHKMILPKEKLPEAFFQLSTGLAGEILQKYTNYDMKLAIVGSFDMYDSKSLEDFIRESNRGNQVYFLPDVDIALQVLHNH